MKNFRIGKTILVKRGALKGVRGKVVGEDISSGGERGWYMLFPPALGVNRSFVAFMLERELVGRIVRQVKITA